MHFCLITCFFLYQGLESCLKGPDNYNSQVLIEATVIALTKLQPLLSKVNYRPPLFERLIGKVCSHFITWFLLLPKECHLIHLTLYICKT